MTKTLLDLINRSPSPAPWSEGDNIPWDDPGFSERMLAEHLSQEHDLASRKSATIERQVGWIFTEVLGAKPARLLDLACGPGLYTSRLARSYRRRSPGSPGRRRPEALTSGCGESRL